MKLDISKKYSLSDVDYLGELSIECDNCSRGTNNAVIARDEEGIRHIICFDCMQYLNMSTIEKRDAEYQIKLLEKFASFLEHECKTIVVFDDGECFLYDFVYENIDDVYKDLEKWWLVKFRHRVQKNFLDPMLKKVKTSAKFIYEQEGQKCLDTITSSIVTVRCNNKTRQSGLVSIPKTKAKKKEVDYGKD